MKRIQFALLVVTAGLFSCDSNTKTTATATGDTLLKEVPKTETSPAGPMCFTKEAAGDTFRLQLNVADGSVTGELKYIFKEKDSNRGTIQGTMKGDTLLADYTFQSEGTTSTRQVAFLIKDGEAVEGYGDLMEKDGKLSFKDAGKLTFAQGIVMKKSDCSK